MIEKCLVNGIVHALMQPTMCRRQNGRDSSLKYSNLITSSSWSSLFEVTQIPLRYYLSFTINVVTYCCRIELINSHISDDHARVLGECIKENTNLKELLWALHFFMLLLVMGVSRCSMGVSRCSMWLASNTSQAPNSMLHDTL